MTPTPGVHEEACAEGYTPRWRELLDKANAVPRCGAKGKRTGQPCRGAAMLNGRCRMHGGGSTGARTPEGQARCRAASWKHGQRDAEARHRAHQRAEAGRLAAAIRALLSHDD